MKSSFFYGWILIPVAWIVYGFGISPGYYSFGQFSDAFNADLGLTAQQYGLLFGIFTFLYSGVGPLVGMAQTRIGLRIVITAGSFMASLGFFILSRAEGFTAALIGFSILGGAGIGFSTIIPCQTLVSNWFLTYRARAMGIIFTAGGIVGMGVPVLDRWMLNHHSWREGWLVVSGISFAVGVICFLFVRNTPESIGQFRDGERPADDPDNATSAPATVAADGWTASQAIRTPQFALIVLAACAYAVPWGVVVAHGKLHLIDRELESGVATAFTWMIFASIFGRFSGSIGDYVKPQVVLAGSVLLETIGVTFFLIADNSATALMAGITTGLGFGAAYIAVPVVFADFFGRQAFGSTSGTRILITGVLNALGPFLAGTAKDQLGSYSVAFMGLIVLGLAGAISAFLCPHPGHPPEPKAQA